MMSALFVIEIFLAAVGIFFVTTNIIISYKEGGRVVDNEKNLFAIIVILFSAPIVLHTVAKLLLSFNFQAVGTHLMELRFAAPFIIAALILIYLGVADIITCYKFPVDRSQFTDPQG